MSYCKDNKKFMKIINEEWPVFEFISYQKIKHDKDIKQIEKIGTDVTYEKWKAHFLNKYGKNKEFIWFLKVNCIRWKKVGVVTQLFIAALVSTVIGYIIANVGSVLEMVNSISSDKINFIGLLTIVIALLIFIIALGGAIIYLVYNVDKTIGDNQKKQFMYNTMYDILQENK